MCWAAELLIVIATIADIKCLRTLSVFGIKTVSLADKYPCVCIEEV